MTLQPFTHRRCPGFVLPCLLLLIACGSSSAFALQEPKLPDQEATVQISVEDMEKLRKAIKKLVNEVELLAKRVAELEKERLFDVTRVLLVGEEQRAESLQLRLRGNLEQQLALQMRVDQLDSQLRPENIERLFTGVGLVRPEEARDTVRRRLTTERQGLVAQLEMLRQERNRFQSALASSDVAIQRLRLRLAAIAGPEPIRRN